MTEVIEAPDKLVTDSEIDVLREQLDGVVVPFGHEKEWPELRDFVRRVRCVVCQTNRGRNRNGELVEPESYTAELFRVSDPHHVKTRGSGGVDADNLIPLCRYHHDEVGRIGSISFQVQYNLDFRAVAKRVFEAFMDSHKETNVAVRAYADHRLVLAHLDRMSNDVMQLGEYLDHILHTKRGGKRIYEIVGGFKSFDAYVSAPTESGGLGLNVRTAYRMVSLYRAQLEYGTEEASLIDVGLNKAEVILPMLKAAPTKEEREKLIVQARSMTKKDLEEFVTRKSGRVSQSDRTKDRLSDYLTRKMEANGIELPSGIASEMANEIYSLVFGNGRPLKQTKRLLPSGTDPRFRSNGPIQQA